MKKLLCAAAALLCLTGLTACGGKEEKSVNCTSESKQAAYTEKDTVEFKYVGDYVTHQNEKSVLTFNDEATYKQMVPLLKQSDLGAETKGMKGVEYKMSFDDKKFSVTATVNLDLTKMSGKDYKKLTGANVDSDSKLKIGIEKTREHAIKSQGYKCSALD